MTIPLEQALNVISSLNTDRIQNLFAQSHAKYILQEVNESPSNFPAFDQQLDDKITFAAYALLAAGCSLLEQESKTEGVSGLEAAASLLQNAHKPFAQESRESSFHTLVSAMAFYAAGHYSRAFVTIRQVESNTEIAGIIAAFIRKDIPNLVRRLSDILLQDIPDSKEQIEISEWIITVAIARSVAFVLDYIYTGTQDLFDDAIQMLDAALVISTTILSPAQWWIIRLLKLMFKDFENASLWKMLPPYFGPESSSHLGQFIRLHAFANPPVTELWTSQIAALKLALNPLNRGGVINLRTSAGKTRVAELAIFQTLSSNPSAKVLYLAPFRSLAFEVEKTLSSSFSWLGFPVSHLYGGSRISSVDTELADESSIIIATPEKARVLFRGYPDTFNSIKLIVIDEGHLIGSSDRYVRNELFIEHLRVFAQSVEARILLLSAVLPNTKELAEWVAGDSEAVASSPWKPSAERFGLLRWNGRRVQLKWLGKEESYNPSFVEAKPVSKRKNSRLFPAKKTDAIAATAVRLSSLGPVMIFAGQAQWVSPMAQSILKVLEDNLQEHKWPEHEWSVFSAVCLEELGQDAIELRAARAGIICHSNKLTTQVRFAMEILMRSYPPKIIVATTTLGQGVNVGISSVIVATPYIGNNKTIGVSDFWNICGRAGRAFVDGEGKILYAIDDTRSQKQIRKDEGLARRYFSTNSTDRVESGLLYVIKKLREIAMEANVSFDLLLEMVANNDFTMLAEQESICLENLDLLDDELMALHEDALVNHAADDSIGWVDQVFRESLAFIQSRIGIDQSDTEDVIRFLQARVTSTIKRIPDPTVRKSLVASSLPLSVAVKVHDELDFLRNLVDEYLQADEAFISLNTVVEKIESWARINASSVTKVMPEKSRLDGLREYWLGGVGLHSLSSIDPGASSFCKDLYGYQLPWLIHAISQKLDKVTEVDRINALSQIALLVEIGVPVELAARIFLAGVRSRSAATELAQLKIQFGSSVSAIRDSLHDPDFIESLLAMVSEPTKQWLRLIHAEKGRRKILAPRFAQFRFKQPVDEDILYARTSGHEVFLCSLNGTKKILVESSESMPFIHLADDPRFVFAQKNNLWEVVVRDPRIQN